MKETLSELDLYICQPKDTLTSISKMYNIEVDDILLLNPLIKNNELYPGLPLNLPKSLRSKNDTKQTDSNSLSVDKKYIQKEKEDCVIPLAFLYKNYFDTLVLCNDESTKDYELWIDEYINNNFLYRDKKIDFKNLFKNITSSLNNLFIAIETKSLELIKTIKNSIVNLLNNIMNFVDEFIYKKLYNLFTMLFDYIIKLSKKEYKDAQSLFNKFIKKIKKDRQ